MRHALVAIGASIGGVVALESLLSRLPETMPPIVIVQHTLPKFTARLAEQLDATSAIHVVEATHGAHLKSGCAYLAPAYVHLVVRAIDGELRTGLSKAPPIRFHRPSVDALFLSLAELRDLDITAVLLTGMGCDGADGMLALRRAGARTIVQDEASSVVFGMPKEAIARGGVELVASLQDLPAAILSTLRVPGAARQTA